MSLIQLQNHLLIKKILLSTIFFWSKIKLQDTYHEQFEKSSFFHHTNLTFENHKENGQVLVIHS